VTEPDGTGGGGRLGLGLGVRVRVSCGHRRPNACAACMHGCRAQTYSGCLPGPSGSVTFSHLRHVLVRPTLAVGVPCPSVAVVH